MTNSTKNIDKIVDFTKSLSISLPLFIFAFAKAFDKFTGSQTNENWDNIFQIKIFYIICYKVKTFYLFLAFLYFFVVVITFFSFLKFIDFFSV